MTWRAPRVRAVRSVGILLVWIGAVTGLFVVHQIWGTAWSSHRAQDRLAQEFDRLLDDDPSDAPTSDATTTSNPTPTDTSVAFAAPSTTTAPVPADPPAPDPAALRAVLDAAPGDVVARIVAPAIGLDGYVVEGVEADQLRDGPGHYPGTSPLGTTGNAAIAGHRTTYGAPFSDLDRLRPGDLVSVSTPLGAATYEVLDPRTAFAERLSRVLQVNEGSVVVAPDDSWVLESAGDDRLTLTACHPRYSTRQRLVVVARLLTPALQTAGGTTAHSPSASPSSSTTTEPPGSESGITEPAAAAPATPSPSDPPAITARLDAAFDGAPSAVAPTVLFALLTVLVAVGVTVAGRRLGAPVAAGFGALPLGLVLWGLFDHLSLLLPVY